MQILMVALGYVGGSVLVGLLAAVIGVMVGRAI